MKNEIIEKAKKVYQKALKDNIELSFYDGVNLGAEFQTKIMYSEEEVIKIVEKSKKTGLTAEYLILTKQFKKK
jgi:hypothetical protein